MRHNIVVIVLVLLVGAYAFAYKGEEGINGFLSFFFAGSLIWMLINFRVNQPKIRGLEKELAEQKQTAAISVVIFVSMTLVVLVYAHFAHQNILQIFLNSTAAGVYVVAFLLWIFFKKTVQQ